MFNTPSNVSKVLIIIISGEPGTRVVKELWGDMFYPLDMLFRVSILTYVIPSKYAYSFTRYRTNIIAYFLTFTCASASFQQSLKKVSRALKFVWCSSLIHENSTQTEQSILRLCLEYNCHLSLSNSFRRLNF